MIQLIILEYSKISIVYAKLVFMMMLKKVVEPIVILVFLVNIVVKNVTINSLVLGVILKSKNEY